MVVAVAVEKVAVGGHSWQEEGVCGDSLPISQGLGWATGGSSAMWWVLRCGPGDAGPAWGAVVAVGMAERSGAQTAAQEPGVTPSKEPPPAKCPPAPHEP